MVTIINYYIELQCEDRFSLLRDSIRTKIKESYDRNSKLAPIGVKAVVKRKIGNVNYKLEDISGGHTAIYHVKDIWS